MKKKPEIIPKITRLLLHGLVTIVIFLLKHIPKKKGNGFKKEKFDESIEILLTGTFFSENWILNHLRPLAASKACKKVVLVTTFPLPEMRKVELIYPPSWLIKWAGKVPSRLLTFIAVSLKRKPAFICGFHLLLNGLLAALLSRITGTKSIYFCGGGPREVLDGGIHGSTLFGLMKYPDRNMEKKLIKATGYFDLIVTMGNRTIDFFRKNGVNTNFCAIPGGIPQNRSVCIGAEYKKYDLIFVGRLEKVKRVDILLSAVKIMSEKIPDVRLAIIGTGSLETELKELTESLGIHNNVTFCGYQRNVFAWLSKSKVFVITSESEGLPLALMEAMTAGLPCVVSDVGEIGEIVENGKNGFLVKSRSPELFAESLLKILFNTDDFHTLSKNALDTASNFEVNNSASKWERLFKKL